MDMYTQQNLSEQLMVLDIWTWKIFPPLIYSQVPAVSVMNLLPVVPGRLSPSNRITNIICSSGGLQRNWVFKHIKIYKTDVFIACKKLKGRKFDLIFADPPYKLDKIDDIPAAIFDNELLAENGIAIIEHPANTDFSSHPRFSEHRQYGSVNFSLFRQVVSQKNPGIRLQPSRD